MTETKLYTQRSVVSGLIGIENASIEFGNKVKLSVENVDGDTVNISVSKTNLTLNINGETLIVPLKNLTECYYFSYNNELVIESKNIGTRIKLVKVEKEEE